MGSALEIAEEAASAFLESSLIFFGTPQAITTLNLITPSTRNGAATLGGNRSSNSIVG